MTKPAITLICFTAAILILAGLGCTPEATPELPPVTAPGTDAEGTDRPEPDITVDQFSPYSDETIEWNHKLDTSLNQLVFAETRGETEAYAARHAIELVDGSIRVVIDGRPEELSATVKTAARYGTVETKGRITGNVRVLIPITSLRALTEEENIRKVRVPEKPSY